MSEYLDFVWGCILPDGQFMPLDASNQQTVETAFQDYLGRRGPSSVMIYNAHNGDSSLLCFNNARRFQLLSVGVAYAVERRPMSAEIERCFGAQLQAVQAQRSPFQQFPQAAPGFHHGQKLPFVPVQVQTRFMPLRAPFLPFAPSPLRQSFTQADVMAQWRGTTVPAANSRFTEYFHVPPLPASASQPVWDAWNGRMIAHGTPAPIHGPVHSINRALINCAAPPPQDIDSSMQVDTNDTPSALTDDGMPESMPESDQSTPVPANPSVPTYLQALMNTGPSSLASAPIVKSSCQHGNIENGLCRTCGAEIKENHDSSAEASPQEPDDSSEYVPGSEIDSDDEVKR
ncbi:hypothetical protein BC940DRAFT_363500 [Gongronella butleri]|nr:hypothetical protein BC940DRAFT_363500 [Gongronella butleri]